MKFELKVKIAPILNYFYDKYDVYYHEERIYKKGCSKRSRDVVEGYKRGKEAVIRYIEDGGLPLSLYSKEELMTVFEKEFSRMEVIKGGKYEETN